MIGRLIMTGLRKTSKLPPNHMADNQSPEQARAARIEKLMADLGKVSEPGIKAALQKQLEREQEAQTNRAVQVFEALDKRLINAVENLRQARNLAKAAEKEVEILDDARAAFVSGDNQGNVDALRTALNKGGISISI